MSAPLDHAPGVRAKLGILGNVGSLDAGRATHPICPIRGRHCFLVRFPTILPPISRPAAREGARHGPVVAVARAAPGFNGFARSPRSHPGSPPRPPAARPAPAVGRHRQLSAMGSDRRSGPPAPRLRRRPPRRRRDRDRRQPLAAPSRGGPAAANARRQSAALEEKPRVCPGRQRGLSTQPRRLVPGAEPGPNPGRRLPRPRPRLGRPAAVRRSTARHHRLSPPQSRRLAATVDGSRAASVGDARASRPAAAKPEVSDGVDVRARPRCRG